jgi:hypothetical protein
MTDASWLVEREPKFGQVDLFLETPDMHIVSYLRDEWTGAVVHPSRPFPATLRVGRWEDKGGYQCVVGRTGVRFAFAAVDDFLVCFYEATSVVVYWEELNDWLKASFPGVSRADAHQGWEHLHQLKSFGAVPRRLQVSRGAP